MTDTRICLFCEHFAIWPADSGYEYTPGEDLQILCLKHHWKIDIYDDWLASYRSKLLTARACPDWAPCEMIRNGEE